MTGNACPFCHRVVVDELFPIPGFATARACRECVEKLHAKLREDLSIKVEQAEK